MKPILPSTDTAYGSLSIQMSAYDMTLVEHYSQYLHILCNRLGPPGDRLVCATNKVPSPADACRGAARDVNLAARRKLFAVAFDPIYIYI